MHVKPSKSQTLTARPRLASSLIWPCLTSPKNPVTSFGPLESNSSKIK